MAAFQGFTSSGGMELFGQTATHETLSKWSEWKSLDKREFEFLYNLTRINPTIQRYLGMFLDALVGEGVQLNDTNLYKDSKKEAKMQADFSDYASQLVRNNHATLIAFGWLVVSWVRSTSSGARIAVVDPMSVEWRYRTNRFRGFEVSPVVPSTSIFSGFSNGPMNLFNAGGAGGGVKPLRVESDNSKRADDLYVFRTPRFYLYSHRLPTSQGKPTTALQAIVERHLYVMEQKDLYLQSQRRVLTTPIYVVTPEPKLDPQVVHAARIAHTILPPCPEPAVTLHAKIGKYTTREIARNLRAEQQAHLLNRGIDPDEAGKDDDYSDPHYRTLETGKTVEYPQPPPVLPNPQPYEEEVDKDLCDLLCIPHSLTRRGNYSGLSRPVISDDPANIIYKRHVQSMAREFYGPMLLEMWKRTNLEEFKCNRVASVAVDRGKLREARREISRKRKAERKKNRPKEKEDGEVDSGSSSGSESETDTDEEEGNRTVQSQAQDEAALLEQMTGTVSFSAIIDLSDVEQEYARGTMPIERYLDTVSRKKGIPREWLRVPQSVPNSIPNLPLFTAAGGRLEAESVKSKIAETTRKLDLQEEEIDNAKRIAAAELALNTQIQKQHAAAAAAASAPNPVSAQPTTPAAAKTRAKNEKRKSPS